MTPTIIQSGQIFNPITGIFGTGQIQIFPGQMGRYQMSYNSSGNQQNLDVYNQPYFWYVPPGITRCRVRLWGPGGFYGGGGGGFCMKVIDDLSGVTKIPVTVGVISNSINAVGGITQFGDYCQATNGASYDGQFDTDPMAGGVGIGGDVNYRGGWGRYQKAGGGAAGIFGNGGDAGLYGGQQGNAGGGSWANDPPNNSSSGGWRNYAGGNGAVGKGGVWISNYGVSGTPNNFYNPILPTSGMESQYSIDFISCGGGGSYFQAGINGGGGGGWLTDTQTGSTNGGFPGGGGGKFGYGAAGLLIVEY
jgi:hypothetical protein